MKICCIMSPSEAAMAVMAGADALGLVSEMPSGPGVLELDRIRQISRRIPAGVNVFLLTSKTQADVIIEQHRAACTDTIQLCAFPNETLYKELRDRLPGIRLVQVIHVEDGHSYDAALSRAEMTDGLLLDSGRPSAVTPTLGGTGETHNWEISRRIVRDSPVPVFLAGGINPGNIRKAVEQVQPFGIDLCSGVRTDGRLDHRKLTKLFQTLQHPG